MTHKNRVKFVMDGYHPLSNITLYALVRRGFVHVDSPDDAHLVVVGPIGPTLHPSKYPDKCFLVLSDDAVYMDRDKDLQVLDKAPSKEDMPILIPGVAASITGTICAVVSCEHTYITTAKNTLVARISGVFGPNVPGTLVNTILDAVKEKQTIQLYSPGYQTRTLLHEDDYTELICILAERLVAGTTGTFNVSGVEELSAKRLADTLWQLVHGPDELVPIERIPPNRYYRWWVLPDMTKTLAVTSFKFTKSIRHRLRSIL